MSCPVLSPGSSDKTIITLNTGILQDELQTRTDYGREGGQRARPQLPPGRPAPQLPGPASATSGRAQSHGIPWPAKRAAAAPPQGRALQLREGRRRGLEGSWEGLLCPRGRGGALGPL